MEDFDQIIKQLTQAGFLNKDGGINYLNYNIEHPIKDIHSQDTNKLSNAVYILCEMIAVGRKQAMHILFSTFEDNRDDFKRLEVIAYRLRAIENDEYIDFIFDFLESIKSNQKSRVFIRNLIEFFIKYNNNNRVLERLDGLIKNKNFSYRMKTHFKNVKETVLRNSEFSFYND